MKILVVDDSKEDRDLAITYIHKSNSIKNIVTDESNCLNDALSKIEKNNYDVILLDLALPETDGLDTIQQIQNALERNNKQTPIIIFTGLEDYNLGRKAFSLGVKDFLIKDEIKYDDINKAIKYATYGNRKVESF